LKQLLVDEEKLGKKMLTNCITALMDAYSIRGIPVCGRIISEGTKTVIKSRFAQNLCWRVRNQTSQIVNIYFATFVYIRIITQMDFHKVCRHTLIFVKVTQKVVFYMNSYMRSCAHLESN
jgi:hypothetical protein